MIKNLTTRITAGKLKANGWTGGQYSLIRFVFGMYLAFHFAELIPWSKEMFSSEGCLPKGDVSPLLYLFPNMFAALDSPYFVENLCLVASVLSIFLAIGLWDRIAAIALWYLWACLFGRNPFILNPALPYIGILLVAHACLPKAPYGSVERIGDPDPGSKWKLPKPIFAAIWILMAVGYSYSGYTKLVSPSWINGTAIEKVLHSPLAHQGPLTDFLLAQPESILHALTYLALIGELSFAPLALFTVLRPALWTLMLAMHIGLVFLIDFADLSIGMIILHLFTLDPAWIKPLHQGTRDKVFYDGTCGLCHRAVRFILAEDTNGDKFQFSPIGSDAYRSAVGEKTVPDSLVVQIKGQTAEDGHLLVKSQAWVYILEKLGGIWRLLALAVRCVPLSIRDAIYDRIAKSRRQLGTAELVCPVVAPELQVRFE